MSENLRAVPWFARVEPLGRGDEGMVVVVGGSGGVMTVPKGAKTAGVRGSASMVIFGEAIGVAMMARIE